MTAYELGIINRRRPRRPSWTNDPVADEMAYQSYLEDCRDYDENYDDVMADLWEEKR